MKKRTLIFVGLLVLTIQTAMAQFYLGPRAGVNLNNISTPTLLDLVIPDMVYVPGFEWGMTSEYAFNDRFSLVAEAIYRDKGFRVREAMDVKVFKLDVPLGVRVDTRLRYIDVPVMAKYAFGNGPIKGYLTAGPQVGYALNGRIKTRADFLLDFNLTNIPINLSGLNHRRFDVGGVVGAGMEFNTGAGKLFFDARYQQGFLDSFKVPVVELDIKNHGFGFGVGYKIQI